MFLIQKGIMLPWLSMGTKQTLYARACNSGSCMCFIGACLSRVTAGVELLRPEFLSLQVK